MLRGRLLVALVFGLGLLPVGHAEAGPPWHKLVPFQRVDADPAKEYRVDEDHGPWMILVTSFDGEEAEQQAHDLALDLRRHHRLQAYVHRRTFDFTQPVAGLGVDRYGNPKRMRHQSSAKVDQYAVLVGNFRSPEDPRLEESLEKIHGLTPESMKGPRKSTMQKALVRHIKDAWAVNSSAQKARGPLAGAFATRNPLWPDEVQLTSGLDSFVIALNKKLEYSLLKNKRRYSVRVATFRGEGTWKQQEIADYERGKEFKGKLVQAEMDAHELLLALREEGVEAYEFHDRHESIVTIGGFDSLGEVSPEGKLLSYHPAVQKVVDRYSANRQSLPGQLAGLVPKTKALEGRKISFDPVAVPVVVPRQSLGASYARSSD